MDKKHPSPGIDLRELVRVCSLGFDVRFEEWTEEADSLFGCINSVKRINRVNRIV